MSLPAAPVPTKRAAAVAGRSPAEAAAAGRPERPAEAMALLEEAVARDPGDLRARLDLAELLRGQGRLDAAEAGYRAVLEQAPRQFHALLGLGLSARRRGEFRAALDWFEQAAAAGQDPGKRAATLQAADMLRELGRLDEADAACRAALERHPGHAPALLGLGLTARRRQDFGEALAWFEQAAAAGPDGGNVTARLQAADMLRELGRLDEAEAAYRAVLDRVPGHFQALLGLGLAARRRLDNRGALAWFREAAQSPEPGGVGARLHEAEVLRELGRFDEAGAAYRLVLERMPVHAPALVGAAVNARLRGDRAAALALLRRAVAADPDLIGAGLELATELRDRGEIDAALEAAEAMRRRHPDDYRPWLSLAQTRRRAGEREAAHRLLQEARMAHPEHPLVLAELAAEERWAGRPLAAEQLLREVLGRDPDSLPALMGLADIASLTGETEQTLALLEHACARHPGHPHPAAAAAQALADAGRAEEAEALLLAFEAAQGPHPIISLKRSALLQGAGSWDEARAIVRAALAASPQHFGLWMQGFALDRLLDPARALADLDEAPAGNTHEQGLVLHLRGVLEEDRWRLDAAIGLYERALALTPLDPGTHHDLTRAALLTADLDRARTHLRAFVDSRLSINLLQSRSNNISQTHLGQLLDEYALNQAALAELVALRRSPPAERIEPLLDLVRREPDYTPAAISLLVALRECGAFDRRAAAAPGSAAIPRSIVQYWDAPTPPQEVTELAETWRAMNPDHAYRRFDDGAARVFLARHLPAAISRAYLRAAEPAQKADLFRLAYLFVAGGIYADMDDRCRAPIGGLIPPGAALVAWQEDLGTLGNNFIAVVPRSPVIGLALRLGAEAINRGDGDLLWLSTGPALLTRAFARTMAQSGQPWRDWLPDSAVLLRSDLNRAVACHCRNAYKRTARHWQNSAFATRRQAPKQGPDLAP